MTRKTPPGERIAKRLARAGIASRREAERMIEAGRIAVNGEIITRAALNVTPEDRITVDGKPLDAPEPPRMWLYHKPTGLVTTHRDEQGRPTIFDDLPPELPRVLTVGRLDINSEGLLLLTNDGAIKRRLELPSTGWLRKYRVRVKGTPTDATFEPLRQGIEIDGERFQPMTVILDRQQGANAWLTVAIREGRNREVRRAMAHVGLTVNRLIRVSYGPFQLGQLKPGEVHELRPRVVRDQLGLEAPGEADAPARKGAKPARRTAKRPPRAGMGAPAEKPAEKPASRPERKPTGKPTGNLTGKPTGNLTGKPAGSRTAKPTGKSAAKTGPAAAGRPKRAPATARKPGPKSRER